MYTTISKNFVTIVFNFQHRIDLKFSFSLLPQEYYLKILIWFLHNFLFGRWSMWKLETNEVSIIGDSQWVFNIYHFLNICGQQNKSNIIFYLLFYSFNIDYIVQNYIFLEVILYVELNVNNSKLSSTIDIFWYQKQTKDQIIYYY